MKYAELTGLVESIATRAGIPSADAKMIAEASAKELKRAEALVVGKCN